MAAPEPGELRCVTWNIAAINNNPFEYYLTLDGEDGYAALMLAVQQLIDSPGDSEAKVGEIFSEGMWAELKSAMAGLGWGGLDEVEECWLADLSKRRIVTDFLKDKGLGAKRLASMPDRFTNTINCTDGAVVCRPTIINNYDKPISGVPDWYRQWFDFMFQAEVSVKNKKGEAERKKVCTLLQPIKKAKYPALTEEEEAISLPLQMLYLALFDAILVHLIAAASAKAGVDWFAIKMKICQALVVNKQSNVIRILMQQPAYIEAQVIFLQEVAGAFIDRLNSELGDRFLVLVPSSADYVRDQNSVILVARSAVPEGAAAAECHLGQHLAGGDVSVADGDVCMFRVPLRLGGRQQEVVLMSFHGDTAGLASTPVVSAARAVAAAAGLPLIVGIDANTHRAEDPKGATKFVGHFLNDLQEGEGPLGHTWSGDPAGWTTTCNARSYLQPQLNKAVPFADRLTSKATDRNPKDFILFSRQAFDVALHAARDNTGRCEFVDGIDLPTLEFPSDHALVWSSLRPRGA